MIVYPGSSWSPYDVAKGYETALGDMGHTVWAFNYHEWYVYAKGYIDFLAETQGKQFSPDAAMLRASMESIVAMVEFVPDLLLIVTGMGWHRRAYRAAHMLGIPMATILTESPYMDETQAVMGIISRVGLLFANDKVSVEWVEKESGVPTVYLPHSFNPDRHHPIVTGPDFWTDVFFWGTLWQERVELLDAVDFTRYDAKVGGAKMSEERADVLIGEVIDNEDMVRYYCGTKIAINHNRKDKYNGGLIADAYSLGPRAYEISACGAFQLCDDTRPELFEVFEDSVATYSDATDMQRQLDYYLEHHEERQAMANEAWKRVQPCTFQARAENILLPAIEQYLGLDISIKEVVPV